MQITAQASVNAIDIVPLDYEISPQIYFEKIRHLGYAIWLDSCRPQSKFGRYDILSAAPLKVITTRNGSTSVNHMGDHQQEVSSLTNPFSVLKQFLPHQTETGYPFVGGYLGYFSYDLGRYLEKLPANTETFIDLPDMLVGLYSWAVIVDHQEQKTTFIFNNSWQEPELKAKVLTALTSTSRELNSAAVKFEISPFRALTSKQKYFSAINRIHDYIHAGDCYQVNFAQAFEAKYHGDSFSAYLQLRAKLPSPFSCYFEFPEGAILSLSPERFIHCHQGIAETKPIKGTIRRGTSNDEDCELALQLTNSAKDRAENVMIVDLLRNDLSKTCDQVRVPILCELQTFPNVHHLVSTITGNLRGDQHTLDVLAQAFPGGSITGAPKIRSMEIIEELEPIRRSVYCGSLGYISTNGNMDTNIAIRTLVCDQHKIVCWGGGGIVADSTPEQEYEETLTKIGVLLSTLEQNFLSTN